MSENIIKQSLWNMFFYMVQTLIFELLYTLLLLYDILCVVFLLCMFLLYVTVLLPVGVIKDNNNMHRPRSRRTDKQITPYASGFQTFLTTDPYSPQA